MAPTLSSALLLALLGATSTNAVYVYTDGPLVGTPSCLSNASTSTKVSSSKPASIVSSFTSSISKPVSSISGLPSKPSNSIASASKSLVSSLSSSKSAVSSPLLPILPSTPATSPGSPPPYPYPGTSTKSSATSGKAMTTSSGTGITCVETTVAPSKTSSASTKATTPSQGSSMPSKISSTPSRAISTPSKVSSSPSKASSIPSKVSLIPSKASSSFGSALPSSSSPANACAFPKIYPTYKAPNGDIYDITCGSFINNFESGITLLGVYSLISPQECINYCSTTQGCQIADYEKTGDNQVLCALLDGDGGHKPQAQNGLAFARKRV